MLVSWQKNDIENRRADRQGTDPFREGNKITLCFACTAADRGAFNQQSLTENLSEIEQPAETEEL